MGNVLKAALTGCGLFILAGSWVVARAASPDPPTTVAYVDINRYSGRWYEIARYPNRFQRKCASEVTATYTVRDGRIQVANACRRSDGSVETAKGRARATDNTNSKLKVTFFWPFSGDYWILDLAPDYQYAVVGEPRRKYLWILSRSPQMDEATYGTITRRLEQNGYDTAKLTRTAQQ